jgi:hypothetical protein
VSWLATILDELAQRSAIGYFETSTAAAEPTALAALALVANDRLEAAQAAAMALTRMQAESGTVGVRKGEWPGWPTSHAILAWSAIESANVRRKPLGDVANINRAAAWLLANRGRAIQRSENFGHNSELVGWAYAEGTHSWVEPTALAVMALNAAGHTNHPATQEGLAVLLDRQLPGGGYNYGNTYVLGQLIRPHVEPTGIVLLALAKTSTKLARVKKSLAWLERNIEPSTTPMSLAWALLGLRAQGVELSDANAWLETAAQRVQSRDRSPHKLALLALAAKGWPA